MIIHFSKIVSFFSHYSRWFYNGFLQSLGWSSRKYSKHTGWSDCNFSTFCSWQHFSNHCGWLCTFDALLEISILQETSFHFCCSHHLPRTIHVPTVSHWKHYLLHFKIPDCLLQYLQSPVWWRSPCSTILKVCFPDLYKIAIYLLWWNFSFCT